VGREDVDEGVGVAVYQLPLFAFSGEQVPLIAAFLAGILTAGGASIDATDSTPVRLTPDTAMILQLVSQVRAAGRRGELTAWAETGLPSISAIQRHLRCEKRRAQLVWDALRVLDGRRGPHLRPPSVTAEPLLAERGTL
jgi:hypothetical protein